MEATCMQLSIEGERLLKAQDYEGAIEFFEAGLRVGTDDNDVLSAVYNQLGNACFYSGKYNKALEYHKKDLEIAEKIGDRQGMAKAYGNLGNTFKALSNYDNAVRCCEAHLEITREVRDRLGEGRACYNLGNVHHAIGKKKLGASDPRAQAEGRQSVLKAIEYYKTTLQITRDQKDEVGEGRAVGNLGNAYTAIGDYQEAIRYHRRRLEIANNASDLAAKARACGNLGNAYSALGEFTEAIRYYQLSLQVAKESANKAAQGQAHLCLGTTYMQQKNYMKALEHHHKHLEIAESLNDKHGQMRAWLHLRNVHKAMGNVEKSSEYHKKLQAEKQRRSGPLVAKARSSASSRNGPAADQGAGKRDKNKKKKKPALFKKSGGGKTGEVEQFALEDSDDDDDVITSRGTARPSAPGKKGNLADQWLDDSIRQQRQQQQHPPPPQQQRQLGGPAQQPVAMGSERSSASVPKPQPTSAEDNMPMDLLDMLAEANHNTMEDQRAAPPTMGDVPLAVGGGDNDFDKQEDFFDLLANMQSKRIDDQRSTPAEDVERNVDPQAKQVPKPARTDHLKQELDPDSMSFFEMLALSKKPSK